METYNDFLIDLKVSKYVDRYIIENIFSNSNSIKIIENDDKKYDYLVILKDKKISFEIKTDYVMYFTNNLAFEVISKKKSGCIFYTEADYFILYDYFDEKLYIFYTNKLRDFILKLYKGCVDDELINYIIDNNLEKDVYEKNYNKFMILYDKKKWLILFKKYNIIKKVIKLKKIDNDEFIEYFINEYLEYKINKQNSNIYKIYKREIILLLKK